jgi:hypothetical protein
MTLYLKRAILEFQYNKLRRVCNNVKSDISIHPDKILQQAEKSSPTEVTHYNGIKINFRKIKMFLRAMTLLSMLYIINCYLVTNKPFKIFNTFIFFLCLSCFQVEMQHGIKAVVALAVDPSGARLATGSIDYDVSFWDFAGKSLKFLYLTDSVRKSAEGI